ncbi:hypothetical protein C8J57DRAFT_1307224, partial [Mycena rebaudengoi]
YMPPTTRPALFPHARRRHPRLRSACQLRFDLYASHHPSCASPAPHCAPRVSALRASPNPHDGICARVPSPSRPAHPDPIRRIHGPLCGLHVSHARDNLNRACARAPCPDVDAAHHPSCAFPYPLPTTAESSSRPQALIPFTIFAAPRTQRAAYRVAYG